MKMPLYSTCLLLLFLFRTNGKKGHLDESDFCHCYGNFFETTILKVTWYQLYSKFLLINYKAHWQHHFERYLTVEYYMLNLSSRLIMSSRVSFPPAWRKKNPPPLTFPTTGSPGSWFPPRMSYIFLKCSRDFLKVL